jgi:hypothetical protein
VIEPVSCDYLHSDEKKVSCDITGDEMVSVCSTKGVMTNIGNILYLGKVGVEKRGVLKLKLM